MPFDSQEKGCAYDALLIFCKHSWCGPEAWDAAHFDGQKVIDELKPPILKVIKANINRPLEGMWQFAPSIDIIQISHERMNSKMFIT